ncbi:MAG: YciI family protein [Candidatus Dormiibacterota bacterium]
MKYALLIYQVPGSFEALSPEQQQASQREYMAIGSAPGVVGGEGLQGVDHATTVRVRNGRTITTDGPFAETKEIFGGYYLVEADHLDKAIQVASRIPAVHQGGCVEIRPILEM